MVMLDPTGNDTDQETTRHVHCESAIRETRIGELMQNEPPKLIAKDGTDTSSSPNK